MRDYYPADNEFVLSRVAENYKVDEESKSFPSDERLSAHQKVSKPFIKAAQSCFQNGAKLGDSLMSMMEIAQLNSLFSARFHQTVLENWDVFHTEPEFWPPWTTFPKHRPTQSDSQNGDCAKNLKGHKD